MSRAYAPGAPACACREAPPSRRYAARGLRAGASWFSAVNNARSAAPDLVRVVWQKGSEAQQGSLHAVALAHHDALAVVDARGDVIAPGAILQYSTACMIKG